MLGTHLGLAVVFGEASFCMICIWFDGDQKLAAMYMGYTVTSDSELQQELMHAKTTEVRGIAAEGCSCGPTEQLNDVNQPPSGVCDLQINKTPLQPPAAQEEDNQLSFCEMDLLLCLVLLTYASPSAARALVNDRVTHESNKLQLLTFGDSLTEGYAPT